MAVTIFSIIGMAIASESRASGYESRPVEAFRIFPFLEDAAAKDIALRSHLDLIVRLSSTTVPSGELKMEIVSAEGSVPLALDAEGRIEWESQIDQLITNPTINVLYPAPDDGAKVRFSMNMSIQPKLALTAEVNGGDIRLSVDQANAAIRRQAGLLAVAAPKMKGIAFRVTPGTTAAIELQNGETRDLPITDEAHVELKRDRNWELIKSIRFSSPPTEDRFMN